MGHPLFTFPPVTPFVECPNCKKLLELGVTQCPTCRELISEDYSEASALIIAYNTAACSLANEIKGSDAGAVIVAIVSIFVHFGELYIFGAPYFSNLVLLYPIAPLLALLVWFRRFGRFKLGDEKFVRAKQNMQDSLKIWLSVLTLQIALLLLSRG